MKNVMKKILRRFGFEIQRIPKRQQEIRDGINEVEEDFIEFFAHKKKRSKEEIKKCYLDTRNRFTFAGPKYRELCTTLHNLFKIQYNDNDEKELIDSYKFHELLHLFRFISYSYYCNFKEKAEYLTKSVDGSPIVCVDYGCGLGYLSYEIGKMNKGSKVYLVDIESVILDFAKFRFEKRNINVEVISVSKENVYPILPPHNLCLVDEVMEHLKQPLIAYQHINESLKRGGVICGNFSDHETEMFHVSPDLSTIREQLSKNFRTMNNNCYKKL